MKTFDTCTVSFKCQRAPQLFIPVDLLKGSVRGEVSHAIPSLTVKPPAVTNNVCQQRNPLGGNAFQEILMGRGGKIRDNLSGWTDLLRFISLSLELPGDAAIPDY